MKKKKKENLVQEHSQKQHASQAPQTVSVRSGQVGNAFQMTGSGEARGAAMLFFPL